MLAKVYLYRADYANALIYTTEIINSGLYALENDFSMAFSVAGQYGMESILKLDLALLKAPILEEINMQILRVLEAIQIKVGDLIVLLLIL